jgi:hypothetical protein
MALGDIFLQNKHQIVFKIYVRFCCLARREKKLRRNEKKKLMMMKGKEINGFHTVFLHPSFNQLGEMILNPMKWASRVE